MPYLDVVVSPNTQQVDLSAYHGQPGDLIIVLASDDFGVASMYVSIKYGQGNTMESGFTNEMVEGSGHWVYDAKTALNSAVIVEAVAKDRPGGTAIQNATKSV